MTTKPTIILVHGAWGDGSHWRHVIPRLHADGHRVCAVQNPLTSQLGARWGTRLGAAVAVEMANEGKALAP